MIIANKHVIYQLPHEVPNDVIFRILATYEKSTISQKFIELQPSV